MIIGKKVATCLECGSDELRLSVSVFIDPTIITIVCLGCKNGKHYATSSVNVAIKEWNKVNNIHWAIEEKKSEIRRAEAELKRLIEIRDNSKN